MNAFWSQSPENVTIPAGRGGVPSWLKVAYLLWLAAYVPVYYQSYGLLNFLWFCNISVLLIGLAIFLESGLLLSAMATAALIPQVAWIVDMAGRFLLGFHPIGGTEYMLDPQYPLVARLMSCYHAVLPFVVVGLLRRLGYDRRGPWLQAAIGSAVLVSSYLLTDPAENVNWLHKPFNVEQTVLSPTGYFVFALLAYPVVLYLPTHLVLRRFLPTPAGGKRARLPAP